MKKRKKKRKKKRIEVKDRRGWKRCEELKKHKGITEKKQNIP